MTWRFFWGAVVVVAFVVLGVEFYGVAHPGEGDTLSEVVRPILHSHPAVWWATLIAWLAFVAWLIPHWWGRRD